MGRLRKGSVNESRAVIAGKKKEQRSPLGAGPIEVSGIGS